MKKFLFIVMVYVLCIAGQTLASSLPGVNITGCVERPLHFSITELASFQTVQVQLNEVTRDGKYSGVFHYRGVPLRTLLELAAIKKTNADFSKPVDLAILVTDKRGKQVALSWGEVFYRNPAEVIVAISAIPIIPHYSCRNCHVPEVFRSRLSQLHRKIEFPKLVISKDYFSDRSPEGIASIKIVDLHPQVGKKKQEVLFSPGFTVSGAVERQLSVKDLSPYPHTCVKVPMIGEGKGYHGVREFCGVSFRQIIEKAGIDHDMRTIFLISAADGYRSLFSYGEVFLDPSGSRLIIADKINGSPIEKDGKFFLVQPADTMADRDVKAVQNIRVIRLEVVPNF